MADLIEVLRALGAGSADDCVMAFVEDPSNREWLTQAADEIERLRHSERQWMDAANDLLATNDRLREALASVVKHWREFGPEHGFDETLERAALAGGAEPKHAPHCSSIPDASGPAQQCDCGAEPKYPHADEPVMWFDRDRETRAESPAKPQATLGTARHFCLACTRAFGCLPGECTAEPASERRPTCRSCGQFVDSRGKCRIPEHNDDA